MKIPPNFLKWLAVGLIVSSIIGWPLTALTIAASEPPIILGLSWGAILLTGLSFYASSQDGEDIDTILENQNKLMKKMGIK